MNKLTSLIGKPRLNDKPMWMRGMTIFNANGDIDPNTTGYQYSVLTTQMIRAKVIKQVFFEIPPADFMPVIPGTGAWMEGLVTNYTFDVAGPFSTGVINTAAGPAKLAQVDAAIAPKTTPIITWAKGYQYNNVELDKAVASGNWNPITARLEALKKHWDLGLQRTAFLGMSDVGITGLLNNADVTIDTSTITKNISAMTTTEFQTFVSTILGVYRSNSNRTAKPNKLIIPEQDFLGLATPLSKDFPMSSKLDYLQTAFRQGTGDGSFQIMPCAYSDKDLNIGDVDVTGENRYMLYRDDPDCLQMDVPVPFLLRPPMTGNNFTFEGVAVAQFGPVVFFRPRTAMYFDHS